MRERERDIQRGTEVFREREIEKEHNYSVRERERERYIGHVSKSLKCTGIEKLKMFKFLQAELKL